MAEEISVQSGLQMSNGFYYFSQPPVTLREDQTGNQIFSAVQNVGFAAHETLGLPTWTATLGWATFRNVGLTNYIEIGLQCAAIFAPFCKLAPGAISVVKLIPSVAYFVKANIAAEDLQYTILEA